MERNLELGELNPMVDKGQRPLNGVLACNLDEDTVQLVEVERQRCLDLIQTLRNQKTEELDATKLIEKDAKKIAIAELKEPTLSKRKEDLNLLMAQEAEEKKKLTKDSKDVKGILKSANDQAKTSAEKLKICY